MGKTLTASSAAPGYHRNIGRYGGPLVMAAILRPPASPPLPRAAQAAAAIGCLMAVWWMTGAVPLAITALLPLVLFLVLAADGLAAAVRQRIKAL